MERFEIAFKRSGANGLPHSCTVPPQRLILSNDSPYMERIVETVKYVPLFTPESRVETRSGILRAAISDSDLMPSFLSTTRAIRSHDGKQASTRSCSLCL